MPKKIEYRYGIKNDLIQGIMQRVKKFDLFTDGSYDKFYDIMMDIEKEKIITVYNRLFVKSMVVIIGDERIFSSGMYKRLKNFINNQGVTKGLFNA